MVRKFNANEIKLELIIFFLKKTTRPNLFKEIYKNNLDWFIDNEVTLFPLSLSLKKPLFGPGYLNKGL